MISIQYSVYQSRLLMPNENIDCLLYLGDKLSLSQDFRLMTIEEQNLCKILNKITEITNEICTTRGMPLYSLFQIYVKHVLYSIENEYWNTLKMQIPELTNRLIAYNLPAQIINDLNISYLTLETQQMEKCTLTETKNYIRSAIKSNQTFFKPLSEALALIEKVEQEQDDLYACISIKTNVD